MNAETKNTIKGLVEQNYSREYIEAAAWSTRDNNTSMADIAHEIELAALRADNAKLREALDVMVYTVDGLVPDKSRTVKDAIAIARRVLEDTSHE